MLSGLRWVGLSRLFRCGLQIVFIAILARLLSPEDFGIMAIVMTFMAASLIFGDLGLSSAIVQKRQIREITLSTSLWLCILAGFILFIIMLNCAQLISRFFRKEIIAPLIMTISIKFIIDSFGIVHETLLRKDLLFKRIAFVEISETVFYGASSVIFALNGFGVWSLVFGYLLGSLIRTICLWGACSWRPALRFNLSSFGEIFYFARNVLGFKIVNYLTTNLDRLIIGRILGSVALGYYSMAYNISNLPREKLSSIVNRVGFPAFSKIQNDKIQLRNAYLKIITYAAIIVFPLLSGLIILCPEFVRVVFTQKWSAMVVPLQYLCLGAMFFSITSFVGIVFLATGHAEFELRLSIISLFSIVIALIFGVRFGVVGIARGICIYAVVINIIGQLFIRQLIKMGLRSYLKALYPAIIPSAIMCLVLKLFLIWQNLNLGLGDILLLVSSVALGLFIYLLSLFVVSPSLAKEIREMFIIKNHESLT